MLSLQGPKSKEILQMVSSESFDNESFPVSSNKWIEVAGHKVIMIIHFLELQRAQKLFEYSILLLLILYLTNMINAVIRR